MARQSGITAQALGTAGNITTTEKPERRNAEQSNMGQTFLNNLRHNQMNMSANGVNNANTQLMNNYHNAAAQKLNKQGVFGRLAIGGAVSWRARLNRPIFKLRHSY